MPKGIKGFQKGHHSFLNEEIYKKIAEKNKGQKRTEETKSK